MRSSHTPWGYGCCPARASSEIARREGLVEDASELFRPRFYISKGLDVPRAERLIRRTMLRYSYRGLRMLPVAARCALAGIIL